MKRILIVLGIVAFCFLPLPTSLLRACQFPQSPWSTMPPSHRGGLERTIPYPEQQAKYQSSLKFNSRPPQ
jgi:hypothetical protein